MGLHVLAHIYSHYRILGVEKELSQRLAELSLSYTGGAEECEGGDGLGGVRHACSGSLYGLCYNLRKKRKIGKLATRKGLLCR